MRILFVNQFYRPDVAATSQMLADLAEHLAAHGHDVHVVCSAGAYDKGSTAKRLPTHETLDGVHVHRLRATGFAKRSVIGRILDYLTFHLLVGLRIITIGSRYDTIVTLTTPPLVGVYAMFVRRAKHIAWVMDLHPDCEFALGLLSRRNPVARALDWLNTAHFRHADRCVALGKHMAARLAAKNIQRITTIPVWSPDLAPKISEAGTIHGSHSPNPTLTLMYSGNAGLAHTFTAICNAALALRDDPRFRFLFVGGGRRMGEIRAFQQQHNLTNITLRAYVPRDQLAASLAEADVHLVTLRQGIEGLAVPSKLYGIMAAARPAIFVGPPNCEPAEAITQADCGKAFAEDDTDGLVQYIKQLADDPTFRKTLGTNARRAFERDYHRDTCCAQWRNLLEAACGLAVVTNP